MPYEPKYAPLLDYHYVRQSFDGVERDVSDSDYRNGTSYSRSGSSFNSPYLPKENNSPRERFRLSPVTVYNGPRLPTFVWSRKLHRYVHARQPIQVMRLVRIKSPKPRKGLDMPPNGLLYKAAKVNHINPYLSLDCISDVTHKHFLFEGNLSKDFHVWGTPATFMYPPVATYLYADPHPRYTGAASALSESSLGAFYAKCANYSADIAQDVAQYGQMSKLLFDSVKHLTQILLALKHGDLVRAARVAFPGSVTESLNAFLVWQYAIKPLLSDIDGIAKHLAENPESYIDVRSSRSDELPRVSLVSNDSTFAFPSNITDVWTKGRVQVSYKGRFRVDIPALRSLSQLGFGNIESLAWEVIPYSFVADWFIPIGNYLNELEAFQGLSFVSSTRTTFIKEEVLFIRQYGGYSSDYWTTPSGVCGFTNERVYCLREVLSSVPPLPKPSFRNPLSSLHLLEAVALLNQLKR